MNSFNSTRSSATSILILLNIFVFILQYAAFSQFGFYLESIFALNPLRVINSFWIWQPVTYMFLHSVSNFFHIIFNLYLLWIFGSPVEEVWGKKSFVAYYFFSGIGAGLSILLLNFFIAPQSYTLGASGVVFAMLLAFGLTFPESELLLFFVIPIKAKYLVVIYGSLELYLMFSNSGGNVSHIGHIGGLVSGLLYFVLFKRKSLNIGRKNSEKVDESLIVELRNLIQERMSRVEEKEKLVQVEKFKEQALKIKEKLKNISLNQLEKSDQEFVNNLLTKAPQEEWKNICKQLDFDKNDEFCNRCNLFPICLYRDITQKDPNKE